MGLFDTLSGITVGDIFQGISSIFGTAYVHKDGTRFSAPAASSGITFSEVTDPTGNAAIQMFNSSTTDAASLFVPNDPVANLPAGRYYLGARTTNTLTEALRSPKVKITTGMLTNNAEDPNTTLYKISFAGLLLDGSSITIADYTISYANAQLLVVSAVSSVEAILYYHFESNYGITTTCTDTITGSSNNFPIDLFGAGFTVNDVVNGQITLGSSDSAESALKKAGSQSRPFNEAEIAYLDFIAKGGHKKPAKNK